VTTESFALFGQTDFDLSDTLVATLGLRYTDDERSVDYDGFDNFGGGPSIPDSQSESYDNISYKAQLDWRPNDDTLFFAGITQTHKAGNFRLGIGDPNLVTPHDEEELRSIEVGVKTEFANGKARLNATAFIYDYKDYQAFVVDPSTGTVASLDIINVDAEATGVEVEFTATPYDGFQLLLGGTWMDSTVENVVYPDGVTVRDTELPYAPKLALNGLARYSWSLGDGTASVQADANYSDDFCFSVLCAPLDQESSYTLTNARVKYVFPGDKWSVALFANNLTEEEYRIYSIDVSGLGIANDAFGNPRTYGITVDANF